MPRKSTSSTSAGDPAISTPANGEGAAAAAAGPSLDGGDASMLSVVTDASTTSKARVNGKAAKEDADSLGVDVCILVSLYPCLYLYLLRKPTAGNPPLKWKKKKKKNNPTTHPFPSLPQIIPFYNPSSPQACKRLSPPSLTHSLTHIPTYLTNLLSPLSPPYRTSSSRAP